jgi:hypothetical protein
LLRAAFVGAASILPLFLFYLHAVIRRDSAFNAFISALDRLGLLEPIQTDGRGAHVESEPLRQTRIKGYADRFAAAYGARPAEVAALLLRTVANRAAGESMHESLRGVAFQWRSLLAPIGVTVVAFLGWMLALPPLPRTHASGADEFSHILSPSMSATVAAFLGAYVFAIEMIRRRFILRDLNVNLYASIMTRLIFSVALAAVIEAIGWIPGVSADRSSAGFLWVAFAVGVLPTVFLQILLIWLQQMFPRSLTLSRGELPLRHMDGIDIWHEARLDEEDIQDIENLACANLVNLIVSTRYSADRLVDWVDQAILYTVIGPEKEKQADPNASVMRAMLRRFGIRTATDLIEVLRCTKAASGERPDAEAFPYRLDKEVVARITTMAMAVRNHPNYPLVRNWRPVLDIGK